MSSKNTKIEYAKGKKFLIRVLFSNLRILESIVYASVIASVYVSAAIRVDLKMRNKWAFLIYPKIYASMYVYFSL